MNSANEVTDENSDPLPLAFVMFTDDSCVTTFNDQSRVQLSACGTAFQFDLPPSARASFADTKSASSLSSLPSAVQQKSAFATSCHRKHVAVAMQLRNSFARQPLIIQRFVGHSVQCARLYQPAKQFNWPLDQSPSLGQTGELSITDTEGLATVTISGNRCDYRAEYLAGVSDDKDGFQHVKLTVLLVPVVQLLPICWRIPVLLLLGFVNEAESLAASSEEEGEGEENNNNKNQDPTITVSTSSKTGYRTISVPSPKSQPLRCHNPHLHRFDPSCSSSSSSSQIPWLAQMPLHRQISKVCHCGIVYHLLRQQKQQQHRVIAQLPDGCCLVAERPTVDRFELIGCDGQRRCCLLEAVGQLGQGVGDAVACVGDLCRYLHGEQVGDGGDADCVCWRSELKPSPDQQNLEASKTSRSATPNLASATSSTTSLATGPSRTTATSTSLSTKNTVTIPGIGRFSSNSSTGRLQILFEDRVSIEYSSEQKPGAAGQNQCLPPHPFARVLGRDGHHRVISLNEPPVMYTEHARAAVDWLRYQSCDRGHGFYNGACQCRTPDPIEEVSKIRQFLGIGPNYRDGEATDDAGITAADVEEAINRTRKFLDEN